MTLGFREVTEENFFDFIELEVKPDQKNSFFFKSTKPNLMSLAQMHIHKGSRIVAIYDGEEMVGSMFFTPCSGPGKAWLTRFMIDQRYQGRGFGRQAMIMLFDIVRRENGGRPTLLGLSYEPENNLAENLYRSLGFKDEGEMMKEQKVVWKEV